LLYPLLERSVEIEKLVGLAFDSLVHLSQHKILVEESGNHQKDLAEQQNERVVIGVERRTITAKPATLMATGSV